MTRLDRFLFWYTLIFVIVLVGSILRRGFTPGNLTLLALFLPLTFYVLLQALKRYYLWKQTHLTTQSLNPNPQPLINFSLKNFLAQKGLSFHLTLVLLGIAILTTMVRFLRL